MNLEGKLHLQGCLWNNINNNKNEEKPDQIKHGPTIKWSTIIIKKSCRRKYNNKEKIRDTLIENKYYKRYVVCIQYGTNINF